MTVEIRTLSAGSWRGARRREMMMAKRQEPETATTREWRLRARVVELEAEVERLQTALAAAEEQMADRLSRGPGGL